MAADKQAEQHMTGTDSGLIAQQGLMPNASCSVVEMPQLKPAMTPTSGLP